MGLSIEGKSFYFNSDGNKDNFIECLGHCGEKNLYLILKNIVNFKREPCHLFAGDINPILVYKNVDGIDEFYQLYTYDANNIKVYDYFRFKSEVIKNNPDKVFEAIDNCLNKGKMVMVTTVCQLIPFSRWFGRSFEEENYNDEGHAFLIVGGDENNYYYTDYWFDLNEENMVFYKNKKDVGVLAKKEFYNAFKILARYYELEEKNVKNKDIEGLNYENTLVRQIIENYNCTRIDFAQGRYYCRGREAITKLIEMINNNKLCLYNTIEEAEIYLHENFIVALNRLLNKRILLNGYLKNNLDTLRYSKSLSEIFDSSISKWKVIKIKSANMVNKNSKEYKKHLSKIMVSILDVEDSLINELSQVDISLR